MLILSVPAWRRIRKRKLTNLSRLAYKVPPLTVPIDILGAMAEQKFLLRRFVKIENIDRVLLPRDELRCIRIENIEGRLAAQIAGLAVRNLGDARLEESLNTSFISPSPTLPS
jgi:hypothetical protein